MAQDTLTLAAQMRTTTDRPAQLRTHGRVPAILYGHGIENRSLSVALRDLEHVFSRAGSNTVVTVAVDDGASFPVLLSDVQRDPLRGTLTHADFLYVRMDEEIEAEIPLVFTGESAAVKMGGTLVHTLSSLPVRALPANLPHEISVAIARLATFDDSIAVKDLELPASVTVAIDPETVVAIVTPPRSDEELAALNSAVEENVTAVEGVADKAPASADEKEKKK
jgi:large subunit ribosomal protein L25